MNHSIIPKSKRQEVASDIDFAFISALRTSRKDFQ